MMNLLILLMLFTATTWGEEASTKTLFNSPKTRNLKSTEAEEHGNKALPRTVVKPIKIYEVNDRSDTQDEAPVTTALSALQEDTDKSGSKSMGANKLISKLAEIKKTILDGNYTDTFVESANGVREKVKSYIKSTNLEKLKEDARSFVSLNLPEAELFSNLIGLNTGSLTTLTFFLFIGWPLLLLLVYAGLIVFYPNRRSDNLFEKNLSTMVETMSWVSHMAEDSFLDFMEDITQPEDDSYVSASHFLPAYAFPDPDNRQEVYYKPTAFYDEYGENVDTAYDYNYDEGPEGGPHFDAWGNPIDESASFVNPHGAFHNPVSSFSPGASSEPLREQIKGGDVSSLGGGFDLQNEIAQKDKHNFLSVILGTQYQHSKPQGSLAEQGVIQGTVGPDITDFPQPPKGYRPPLFLPVSPSSPPSSSFLASSFSNAHFEADVDPRQPPSSSGFRPSDLVDPDSEEDDWVARPRPFRRHGNPAQEFESQEEPTFRFPVGGESRLQNRGGKAVE